MKKLIATIPKNGRERLQVDLSEYRGHDLLGIRVYADNGREWVPTTKGITVKIDLLKEIQAALATAEREARQAGLLAAEASEAMDG